MQDLRRDAEDAPASPIGTLFSDGGVDLLEVMGHHAADGITTLWERETSDRRWPEGRPWRAFRAWFGIGQGDVIDDRVDAALEDA